MPTGESNTCEAAAASGALRRDLQLPSAIAKEIALRRAQDKINIAQLDRHYQGDGTLLSSEDVKALHQALDESSKWYKEQQMGMAAGLGTEEA